MKTEKTYEITWQKETLNSDAFYQVKSGDEFLACFPTREKAEKYVQDKKHTVVLRTRKIGSHFRGITKRVYFPMHGHKFTVLCESYSGGKAPLLDVTHFIADTESELMDQLVAFKKQHNLILETI
jgi:hypothetical protein